MGSVATTETPADVLGRLLERRPELASAAPALVEATALFARTFSTGNVVLVCGNGGSAADAEHIVGELMKGMTRRRGLSLEARSRLDRTLPAELATYLGEHLEGALPAISLVHQPGLSTAIGNDTASDMCFAQQVHAYGRPGDVLWAISTSGSSRNVVLAAATARSAGMAVVAMTGCRPSALSALADVWLPAPCEGPSLVQEDHLPMYHCICELLEDAFFPPAQTADSLAQADRG
jgi:phosphoheptose isomerase